ncbi:MAG: sulfite exporter TauE/SafE family protein [Thioalkalivibrionaceae bacterium]
MVAAVVIGVLGGVHCVGMCGGIVGALSIAATSRSGAGQLPSVPVALPSTHRDATGQTSPPESLGAKPLPGGSMRERRAPSDRIRWDVLLGYNIGRVASYTAAGALAGGIGALAVGGLDGFRQVLSVLAALLLIAAGLYLGRWWTGLTQVERVGARLWRRIEPFARRLIPIRGASQAVAAGAIWGWLPCGLVYSVLIWALAAASPIQGALIMLAFGIGTLPNLILMGAFALRLRSFFYRPIVRVVAGVVLIAMGVWALVSPWVGAIHLD